MTIVVLVIVVVVVYVVDEAVSGNCCREKEEELRWSWTRSCSWRRKRCPPLALPTSHIIMTGELLSWCIFEIAKLH